MCLLRLVLGSRWPWWRMSGTYFPSPSTLGWYIFVLNWNYIGCRHRSWKPWLSTTSSPSKAHLWGFEWVSVGKVNGSVKDASLVRCAFLTNHDVYRINPPWSFSAGISMYTSTYRALHDDLPFGDVGFIHLDINAIDGRVLQFPEFLSMTT